MKKLKFTLFIFIFLILFIIFAPPCFADDEESENRPIKTAGITGTGSLLGQSFPGRLHRQGRKKLFSLPGNGFAVPWVLQFDWIVWICSANQGHQRNRCTGDYEHHPHRSFYLPGTGRHQGILEVVCQTNAVADSN